MGSVHGNAAVERKRGREEERKRGREEERKRGVGPAPVT
jgi:hypothetical protein